jgi:uncharacterized Zn-binding protein involved in type VI secretion
MSLSICCEGDRTSHDGEVLQPTGSMCINGRRNARIGDMVSCPRHGDNPIVEKMSILLDNGVAVAVHGCRSECGSIVIADDLVRTER